MIRCSSRTPLALRQAVTEAVGVLNSHMQQGTFAETLNSCEGVGLDECQERPGRYAEACGALRVALPPADRGQGDLMHFVHSVEMEWTNHSIEMAPVSRRKVSF